MKGMRRRRADGFVRSARRVRGVRGGWAVSGWRVGGVGGRGGTKREGITRTVVFSVYQCQGGRLRMREDTYND